MIVKLLKFCVFEVYLKKCRVLQCKNVNVLLVAKICILMYIII